MSKYPVLYESGSKKELLQIEHMVTPHLCNSWRKLGRQIAADEVENRAHAIAVCAAMKDEIVDRGGVYDHETDQWVFPPKPTDQGLREAAQEQKYDLQKEEGETYGF